MSLRHLFDSLAREPWEHDASCRDLPGGDAIFFPDKESPERVAIAKAICDACPVVQQCEELALSIPPGWPGIFAGLSRQDRIELHLTRQTPGMPHRYLSRARRPTRERAM